jgi:hypothetical protein
MRMGEKGGERESVSSECSITCGNMKRELS